jgi:hypothetical protein
MKNNHTTYKFAFKLALALFIIDIYINEKFLFEILKFLRVLKFLKLFLNFFESKIFKHTHTPVQNMYTDANEDVNIANIEKRMPLLYIVKIKHIIQHEHIERIQNFCWGRN